MRPAPAASLRGSLSSASGLPAEARGPLLDAPIRSVLFGETRFAQHGVSLAQAQASRASRWTDPTFFPRLADNIATLRRAMAALEKSAAQGRHLSPTAQWLLDNAALIEEQLGAIRLALPRRFYRRLPVVRDDSLRGLPRVVGIAWAWVAHSDSGFDEALFKRFLSAYQEVQPLTIAELWALHTTLRVVLVENLRRLSERVVARNAARDAAHAWVDASGGELPPEEVLRTLERRGVLASYLLTLWQRLELQHDAPWRDHAVAWLAQHLPEAAASLAAQQNETAEDQQSIRNAITTLHTLSRVDWVRLVEPCSETLRLLLGVPVHAAEDAATQSQTLHAVEHLARASGRSESEVARTLAELSATAAPGDDRRAACAYWWRGDGEPELRARLGLPPRRLPRRGSVAGRRLATPLYLGAIGLALLALMALLMGSVPASVPSWLWWLTLLCAAGPASEACVAVISRLVSESVPPTRLPRLALGHGLGERERCLVVMPVILSDAADVARHAAQLEQHALANPEHQAQFALLSDFADAPGRTLPGDAALLESARQAISALNRRHGAAAADPRFLLLHREREWSESEQCWIGWERKRGKLEALVRALAEPGHRPFVDLGALSTPRAQTRFVITLDADTDLLPGRLRQLVGIAAHPLNRPRFDPALGRVVEGWGIVQPRVETPLPAPASVTRYHALFNGQCGLDPYSAAASEVYQDLFGEGSFSGKGLLDVAAVHQVLSQRFPEGRLLSHDLIEGSLARCAAASDVTVAEDAPLHADVAAARLHRWTRGDWQLLPFVFSQPLASINRWKMLDNLRRSLVAPSALALLLLALGAGVLPLGTALAVVVSAFIAGPLIGAVAALAPSRDDIALARFYGQAGTDLLRALGVGLWHLAQLLALALMYADAIGRALWRQFVSHRCTLQWTPYADAAAPTAWRALLRRHWRVPAAALGLGALLALAASRGAPVAAGPAAALLALWALSPLWTAWVSRPHPRALQAPPTAQDIDYLRQLARDTWRFYERHVGAEDHHLPPDNVQLVPRLMVAHRTSPTNIGLYLLAVASARELGFIGTVEMAERVAATLDTVEHLPKHHGHLPNWIDTERAVAMQPVYLSAVDSGNLAAHLLLLAQACEERAAQALTPAATLEALHALLRRPLAMRRALGGAGAMATLTALIDEAEALATWPPARGAAERWRKQLAAVRQELDALVDRARPGLPAGPAWMLLDLVQTLDSQLRDLPEAALDGACAALRRGAERARALALAMDFAPLYDRSRRLLHIGLHVDSGQLDRGHYDLLASEARLASLVAIAKGDVPAEHWQALGRPFGAHGRDAVLRSWSGSMFEYLMPTLVLDEPPGSALELSARTALAEHRREAAAHDTPWGISESAIALQDQTLAYQYGPQGVARLALRRTPADERVIAPYASGLALRVDPVAAVANLRALEGLDARRAYGFIESIDYTPQRQVDGGTRTLVQTHMAHHQAMLFIAAASVVSGGVPQGWARRQPHLRAVAGLLQERAPREVLPLRDRPPPPPPTRVGREPMVLASAPLADPLPPTQWLGNRRYGLVLRSNGAGHAHCLGQGLTRWRDDLLRDERGSFVYLQRAGSGSRYSATAHPAPDPAAEYRCRMQPDRVIFECRWSDLTVCTTVWVSPEDDCELRQVELVNTGEVALEFTLHLAAEPTLAPPAADAAHPAFSNLFVEASWDASENALWLRRQPRLQGDTEWRAVHALASAEGGGEVVEVRPCADRARWLGRYGSAAQPVGPGGWSPLSQPHPALPGRAMDTGLDPAAVLSVRQRLPAGASCILTFVAAAGTSQDALETLVDKYRQPQHTERASNLSHTMASILLHDMRLDAASWAALLRLQTLLGSLAARELPADISGCDRRALYRHGIGGERPILAVTVRSEAGLPLLHTLLRATLAWAVAGQGVDLVIVNGEPASYLTPVQHELLHWMPTHDSSDGSARPAIKLLREDELDATERATLALLARVRLHADGRSLAEQVERLFERHERDAQRRARVLQRPVERPWLEGALPGPGTTPTARFDADDGRCSFAVSATAHPPRPWVNVLANPRFGCHVSEMAGGHTWAGNSRMHQITRWANDPVCDPPGEWLLLEDADSGRVWPLGRALQGAAPRTVEHGIGFTAMTQRIDGIEVRLEWCVDPEAALKQCRVRLRSVEPRARSLRLVALVEWMLGPGAEARATLATRCIERPDAARRHALLATQLDASGGFGGATAWLALAGEDDPAADEPWTCDRREWHDASGALVLPARLGEGVGLGGDACAALGRPFVLERGREVELTLLLGHVDDAAQAPQAIAQALAQAPAERLARQRAQWRTLGRALQVKTPDAAFDAMVNHWLPYQTVACRLWARAGYYQTGGAFGFRDQLQDAMSMLALDPALLAAQLRASAARQFPEGDVQHWWHEPGGAGVRTHFSDDRVWLPYALAHYVERTGDAALAEEVLPFIEGRAVPEGAEDVYETPRTSDQTATLYEHAARALDRSLAAGRHGLPLMGSGDWNDGMNRVGHGGQGESVWLAWFLCATIDAMLPLAERAGDKSRAQRWRGARQGFAQAVDRHAWDGQWYRRATFDDGSWLGTRANPECRIDLIAQAWAVLSGAGDPGRAPQALAAASQQLWDEDAQLLRLLTPPLRDARPAAGYIQAYPAGVRENGGQYNHAAAWAVMAAAQIGRSDWAWAWWRAISPAHRVQDATHPARGPAYGGEPFVLAGDIYTAPPWTGRCGWSWYTGSAGWLWRAGVESLCGVQLRRQLLRIDPCLPRDWVQLEVRVQGIRVRLATRREDAARWRHEPGWRGALPVRQWLPLSALQGPAGDGGFFVVDLSALDDSALSPRPTQPAASRHET